MINTSQAQVIKVLSWNHFNYKLLITKHFQFIPQILVYPLRTYTLSQNLSKSESCIPVISSLTTSLCQDGVTDILSAPCLAKCL